MTNQVQKIEPSNPSKLLELAISKDVDIEKLEKLMGLQERWLSQQAKKSYLVAFSEFQEICPVVKKTKKASFNTKNGGKMSYNFAPLGSVINQIKPSLKKCGISYRWETKEENENIQVTCIISHLEGHYESNTMTAKKDTSGNKNDIQQKGSTITYLQRYTLLGALGIGSAEDDLDGIKPGVDKDEVYDLISELKPKLKECKTLDDLGILWDSYEPKEQKIPQIEALFKQAKSRITKPKNNTLP